MPKNAFKDFESHEFTHCDPSWPKKIAAVHPASYMQLIFFDTITKKFYSRHMQKRSQNFALIGKEGDAGCYTTSPDRAEMKMVYSYFAGVQDVNYRRRGVGIFLDKASNTRNVISANRFGFCKTYHKAWMNDLHSVIAFGGMGDADIKFIALWGSQHIYIIEDKIEAPGYEMDLGTIFASIALVEYSLDRLYYCGFHATFLGITKEKVYFIKFDQTAKTLLTIASKDYPGIVQVFCYLDHKTVILNGEKSYVMEELLGGSEPVFVNEKPPEHRSMGRYLYQ